MSKVKIEIEGSIISIEIDSNKKFEAYTENSKSMKTLNWLEEPEEHSIEDLKRKEESNTAYFKKGLLSDAEKREDKNDFI